MYNMLLPFRAPPDISPDQLRRQLEREYGLPIDSDNNLAMDPPTPEEQKRALSSACVTQMARLPAHERWARFGYIYQRLRENRHRSLLRNRMLQFLSDWRSSGTPNVRESVNENAPPARGTTSLPIHQFAHISEVEHEPQQEVKWVHSFRTLRRASHGHPRENSPQYTHIPSVDHVPLDDRDLSGPLPTASTATISHKSTHRQSRSTMPIPIAYAFTLCTTLISASMIFARFLRHLFIISLLITKESKRRIELRYPSWKVYIDAAFIAVGLVVLWLIVLLGHQGWKTLSWSVHELSGYLDILVRWSRRGDFVQS